MILYNCKSTGEHDSVRITKFDDDLNQESSYLTSQEACECPQGHKSTCRHRKMLGAILPIVDTEKFFCYNSKTYHMADGTIAQRDEPSRRSLAADEDLTTHPDITAPKVEAATTQFRRRV